MNILWVLIMLFFPTIFVRVIMKYLISEAKSSFDLNVSITVIFIIYEDENF